jgi:formylglycine-generating enzyme required for sulfatase activity
MWAVFLLPAFAVLAGPPQVSNVRASQRPGTQLVDIYYNVYDPDGDSPLTVYVAVSDNAGTSYNVPVFTLDGAAGPGVMPGIDRHVTWNAGADWPGRYDNDCKVRIIAEDGTAPPAPTHMVYIPGGVFQMGDNFYEGSTDELPLHNVYISAFFMDKYEVWRERWLEVYSWAIGHGYTFDNGGSAKANGHPIQTVNWYDAVKWCNARSEKEGLTPCYYTDSSHSTVYRSTDLNILNNCVDWDADGYRLPTEAEWEKAARGGLNDKRYPWGDSVSHSDANYSGDPVWATGGQPYTSVKGSFPANGYGLFDMAGNVWEWCWDWYSSTWYGQAGATVDDNAGPPTAQSYRVWRGGSWYDDASLLRCADRNDYVPDYENSNLGFRCVRGL